MTEFTESQSGLVIPAPKPVPPKRHHPPLEIQEDDQREKVKEALSMLWDAMKLSEGCGGIVIENKASRPTHWWAYHAIGEMLLGDECPEKECYT